MRIEFEGKLVYGDNAEYLMECGDGSVCDLSAVLSDIYMSDANNVLNVRIEEGVRLIFAEDDILYRAKNAVGIYSYHIAMEDFEDILFRNTEKFLNIIIESPVVKNAEEYKR